MWGFWIMAPQCAVALPGTPVAEDDLARGKRRRGVQTATQERDGSDEKRGQCRPKPKEWGCDNLVEQMRRSDGDVEGMEGRSEMPLWWQDSFTSGPQKACQGLNGITPHVIYFMALGGCPMCQELQKIPTAILTLCCSWHTNTLISHLKRGMKWSVRDAKNELITWCLNCSTIIALVHRTTTKVRR